MDLVLIIDLVLVGLIVLFSIIGLIKGFFKSFLDFFGTIVSLIISVLLAGLVAGLLIRIPPVDWLFGSDGVISNSIGNGLVKLSDTIFNTSFSSISNTETLTAMLTEGGIPAFLSPILAGVVSQFNFSGESVTLAQILAPMIANVIFLIVVTVILFILLKVILSLFNRFFRFLTRNKVISGLNRFFGFIIGALKGVLFAAVVLIIISLLPNTGIIASFNESLENTALAKHFNTFVYDTVGKNIDLDKLIAGLFPNAKKMTEKETGLYSKLNIDFTAEGRRPSDFGIVSGDAEAAVSHFSDYNSALLGKIGGNNFTDAQMDGYIGAAEALSAKYASVFEKLESFSAGDDTSEIETLLREIDALYQEFNAFAQYTLFY